jgi:hypothetical protein
VRPGPGCPDGEEAEVVLPAGGSGDVGEDPVAEVVEVLVRVIRGGRRGEGVEPVGEMSLP